MKRELQSFDIRPLRHTFERILIHYYYICVNIFSSENRKYNYLFVRTKGKVKKRCERVKEGRKFNRMVQRLKTWPKS